MMTEKKVIVEVKSVETLNEIHLAQILTYLKLTDCRVGLLINFNVLKLTDGLKRVVNKYQDLSDSPRKILCNSAVN